jgi:predicted PolB exonuclease-like 3'-5' exonuclease
MNGAWLAFDVETVPDVELGRRLYGLAGVDDAHVGDVMLMQRHQRTGSDFLPFEQHRIVAISVALRTRDSFRVWSLGEPESPEHELVERFFRGIEEYTPELVSWNGSGFDLPVLHFRALRHGVAAPRYWETGEHDAAFRYNNYLSRYHWRHCDLMDVLSGFQNRGRAGLESAALLLGLPGKLGMSGDRVRDAWLSGEVAAIRHYCETDVLNTYLIWLHFLGLRGRLTRSALAAEEDLVRAHLDASGRPHLREFLQAWRP